ncbi:MAG TPA: hypothetical protein VFA26_21535 [Gemmataceae bacterium]|nr:hypothetical protein [Gemmataceae bacterium]
MLYFLLHDAGRFRDVIVPPLAAAWRRRSFAPCAALAEALAPAVRRFAEAYHIADEPLLPRVAGLPFDRAAWRLLAGEVLLCAADEIPELQTAPDALCLLLAPERYHEGPASRERLAPVEQAHFGSRDVAFGPAVYRPDHAGLNDAADVARLADYLAAVDEGRWAAADLAGLRDVDPEDLPEELEYVREWFPALRELYEGARRRGQVVVCETL